MLISQIIDENASHKLESLTDLYLGPNCSIKKRMVNDYAKEHKIKSFGQIPIELLAERVEEDAFNTFSIYELIRSKLKEKKVYELEKKLLIVLLKMERNGALIDKEYLLILKKDIEYLMGQYEEKYPDVDLNSGDQVGKLLFQDLGITPTVFTEKRKVPATDAKTLSEINHPVAKEVTEYRNLQHTLSTYVNGFLDLLDLNNLLHCKFNQMGARTGRMSCVDPNLQQLPTEGRSGKWIRSAFIGNITTFDYSQMEGILYAYDNHEEGMIKAIENNIDIYRYLASILYAKDFDAIIREERNLCKSIFLGRIYGMGDRKFISMSKGLNPKASKKFFGKLKEAHELATNKIETYGYIETIIGRRRHLPLSAAYKGVNARIQGSAADIIKTAMINLPNSISNKMICQVHDELVFMGLEENEKKVISEIMCDFSPYKLRVDSGSGKNWWEAYEAKENKGKVINE